MTQTVPDISPLMPMHQDPLLVLELSSHLKLTKETQRLALGWGLLSQFAPFRYFPIFSASPKYMVAVEHHIHIWQVSPQLSCGDTRQIWMWCKESNRYICKFENFAYGEIIESSFSDPHPRWASCQLYTMIILFKPGKVMMGLYQLNLQWLLIKTISSPYSGVVDGNGLELS